ncbi:MAG: hypothetical protein KF754_12700 [Planctomycetes bacterium]|nr:hypothetical protein [Planctomycetota bacterium]
MQSPLPYGTAPDQPSLAVGQTLNAGVRVGGWIQIIGGAVVLLSIVVANLVIALLASTASSGSGAMSTTFGFNVLLGAFLLGFGVWTLQRFPLVQILENGLKIRDTPVPFASVVEVVKKERTVLCLRYVDQGVTNEVLLGVSWMLGSDLAPVARWLTARAESARALQANQQGGPTAP